MREEIVVVNDVVRYLQLKKEGYRVIWVGEGKICMAPPKEKK